MDLTLSLPEPSGVVPIRLTGGAHRPRILRPAGVQARVTIAGGFYRVTFDDLDHEMISGKMAFQSPEFDAASDRFEIEIFGGAHEVAIKPSS